MSCIFAFSIIMSFWRLIVATGMGSAVSAVTTTATIATTFRLIDGDGF